MNNDRIYYSHEAELQALRETTKMTLIYLALGLGIGTALALLFAPSSGRKIRDELGKAVGEGLNTGREAVEPMVKRLDKEVKELRKSVEEHLPNLK